MASNACSPTKLWHLPHNRLGYQDLPLAAWPAEEGIHLKNGGIRWTGIGAGNLRSVCNAPFLLFNSVDTADGPTRLS